MPWTKHIEESGGNHSTTAVAKSTTARIVRILPGSERSTPVRLSVQILTSVIREAKADTEEATAADPRSHILYRTLLLYETSSVL